MAKEKLGRVGIRVPSEIYELLKGEHEKTKVPMAQIVALAVRAFLAKVKK